VSGKKKILALYVSVYFFCSSASDLPIEIRLENYLTIVDQKCGVRASNSSKRGIFLIKVALGMLRGEDFCPDEEAVLYLLRRGYLNPYIKDPHTGATLLHFAAFYGACDVMRYLLRELHISIEVDDEGKTPLHWACNPYHKTPSKKVIKLLVEAKKDLIHIRDFTHKTPLFYLSSYSEAADFLLDLGANINAQDEYGRTVLFRFKNEESTRYLCLHGADVNQADHNRLTALGAYLTDYSSRRDLAKNNPGLFVKDVNEIEKGLKVLLQYGCYIPRMYHPGYRMSPLKSDYLQKEKMKKLRVLLGVFGHAIETMEEALNLVKVRLELSLRSGTIRSLSPLVFFDRYVSALSFFETRYSEMNEILEKEKELGIRSEEGSLDSVSEFGEFLSRLSFSKQISPELSLMACDLISNKEEYVAARVLPDSERAEMGKKILEKIFS